MKLNFLQILIEILQNEQVSLEQELMACLDDQNFSIAKFINEAKYQTNEKLRILKNLENPEFDFSCYRRPE